MPIRTRFTQKHLRVLVGLYLAVSMWSCSLALDTDILQNDHPADSDSDTSLPPECARDADCTDGVACTIDQCGADQQCVYILDNSACGEFEYCDAQTGCTPTGENCNLNSECDDGISCTIDLCAAGVCRNSIDHTRCENSVPFCRAPARCLPEAGGCVEGDVILCDAPADGICMAATCNEQTGNCDEHLSAGADNDTDSALDALCGGDDCDDADNTVYPSATETCDNKDNDCDGLVDVRMDMAGALLVAEAATFSSLKTAAGNMYHAVLWMDDSLHLAVIDTNDVVLTYDLSTLSSGVLRNGAVTAVPSQEGTFYVIYSAQGDSNMTLEVARIEVNAQGDALQGVGVATLDHQLTTEVMSTAIVYDVDHSNPGWLAVWAESDSATGYTLFQHHSLDSAVSVSADTGTVDAVSVSIPETNRYVVAFSANYTGTSGGDTEIFRAEVAYTDAFAVSATPVLVSPADNDGVDDQDPSVQPQNQADLEGNSYTLYLDYLGLGQLKTLTITDDTTSQQQDLLASETSYEIRSVQMVYNLEKLAIAYIIQTNTASRIVLNQLSLNTESRFSSVAQTDLLSVDLADGANISALAASGTAEGDISFAWILNGIETKQLYFAPLQSCRP